LYKLAARGQIVLPYNKVPATSEEGRLGVRIFLGLFGGALILCGIGGVIIGASRIGKPKSRQTVVR
jgi:hypothetical protein